MAARTPGAGTRRDLVMGNIRGVKGEFTDIDDGDTWVPGLAIVETVLIHPRTANPSTHTVSATISNGTAGAGNQATITFDTESANNDLVVTAFGY